MLNQFSRCGRGWGVAAATLMVLAAGSASALAQSSPAEKESARKFNYDRRLGGGEGGSGGGGQATTTSQGATSVIVSQSTGQDGHQYAVRIENGEVVSAQIDGKDVPQDRIRKSDGKVEILDKDGAVVHTVDLAPVPTPSAGGRGGNWTWNAQPSTRRRGNLRITPAPAVPAAPSIPGQPLTIETWTPPPVMLGITMSEPDDDVAEHLGVKPDEVIRVDSVLDGLPASAAGVKEHDIIVSVDGQKPINQEKLREILRGKKAGDTLTLSIISKGKSEDVKIALEAYDPTKLGQGGMTFSVTPDQGWNGTIEDGQAFQSLRGLIAEQLGEAKPKIDEACKAIEDVITQLKQSGEVSGEKIKEQTVAMLSDVLKKLEQKSAVTAEHMLGLNQLFSGQPLPRGQAAPGEGQPRPQVYITPVPGAQPDQIDRLNAALERMEKRLAELEERLDKRPHDAAGGDKLPRR